MDKSALLNEISDLLNYIEEENFKGYDPYDGLNSANHRINNRLLRVWMIQFFKIFPINLRHAFDIPKEVNPKALGVLLSAYVKLIENDIIHHQDAIYDIKQLLLENRSQGFDDYCWGHNFPWQSSASSIHKHRQGCHPLQHGSLRSPKRDSQKWQPGW